MTRTIENSFLKISVSDNVAELTGLYVKTNAGEILRQADPAYGKRYAPVLLPRKRSLPHACPATLHSSRCTSKYHKLSREAAQVRLLRIVSLCTSARQNQTC